MSAASTAGFWKRNQKTIAPWLFLAPGMIMFMLYVIIPIFQSVWISFHEWDGLGPKTYAGMQNYADLFDDKSFWTSLKNNIIWLVLYLLAVPAGLAVALFLNQTVSGIRLYKSLFFFPFVISQVVVGLIFSWFYAPDFGMLSTLIQKVTGSDLAILADDRFATYGIIAAGLWPQTAYCMILYLTGLNNINPEQVEAARMDHAKGWSMLWNIILSQLRPATFIAIVVTVIGALRSFDLVSIMTVGGTGDGAVKGIVRVAEFLGSETMYYVTLADGSEIAVKADGLAKQRAGDKLAMTLLQTASHLFDQKAMAIHNGDLTR